MPLARNPNFSQVRVVAYFVIDAVSPQFVSLNAMNRQRCWRQLSGQLTRLAWIRDLPPATSVSCISVGFTSCMNGRGNTRFALAMDDALGYSRC